MLYLFLVFAILLAILALFQLASLGHGAFAAFFRCAGVGVLIAAIILLSMAGHLSLALILLGLAGVMFIFTRYRRLKKPVTVKAKRVD